MNSIYEYMNYREFLKDFYVQKKSLNSTFSYQNFANMAGFKSKSFIKLVIDGNKNLTSDSAQKINLVLKLNEKSFSYFEDLIAFNQATTNHLKNIFFEKLLAYNKRNPGRLIVRQQYEFYSHWYHNSIRELITLCDFKGDYQVLGKKLQPPISAKQAKDSVSLLLALGLIQFKNGKYIQTDPLVTTGNEVQSLAVANFHLQNLNLAGQALDTVCSEDRDISGLVLGLSQDGFARIKKEVQIFRKKLLQIAGDDINTNRVYNMSFQLWPTSEKMVLTEGNP